ncbi:MAG: hypothetical protein QM710_05705 [Flavobacterium sp.]
MFVVVSKYLIPNGFRGITLFPFILVSAKELKENAVMIDHERIHIRQQIELLVLPFFIWYGLEFLVKWAGCRDRNKAYRNISFEREAYANEKDPYYLKKRPFWNFLRYL